MGYTVNMNWRQILAIAAGGLAVLTLLGVGGSAPLIAIAVLLLAIAVAF